MPSASKPRLPTLRDRTQRPAVAPDQVSILPLNGAYQLAVTQLEADPEQPRRDWEYQEGERRLAELVDSVREFGILQPLLVREIEVNGDQPRFRVVAGGRRLQAALLAGMATVPVVVREATSVKVRVLQLTENLQRLELSPLDEARSFQELMDILDLSAPKLAVRLHVSSQHVRDRLRLAADQVLADAVDRRQIGASVAREILKLPDEALQELRARVEHGERLQIADTVRARARLHAQGISNPRRNLTRQSPISPEAGDNTSTGRAPEGPGTVGRVEEPRQVGLSSQLQSPMEPASAQDTQLYSEAPSHTNRPSSEHGIALSTLALGTLLRVPLGELSEGLRDQILAIHLPRAALLAALQADCEYLTGSLTE